MTSHAARAQHRAPRAKPFGPPGAAVEYTCPMHPEVVQLGPGACPKCGMALEPKAVSLDAPPDRELRDMTRRLIVSAVLSLPLLVVAMAPMVLDVDALFPANARRILELSLATP